MCVLASEVWPADGELSQIFRRGFVLLSETAGWVSALLRRTGGSQRGLTPSEHVDLTPRWQKVMYESLTTQEVSRLAAPLFPPSISPSHNAAN